MNKNCRPAQTIKQVEQNKSRSPPAQTCGCGRFAQEFAAVAEEDPVNAKHAAGPSCCGNGLHPEAEEEAGCYNQQQHR
jgi:hypothetical protein